jgi:glycosyltransferase involved in cell wall biosynthesis
LEKAKIESDKRVAFWQKVFKHHDPNLSFVFVSQYFADEVIGDIGVPLEKSRYSIIHNPIDTDKFNYEPKDPEQRKKILSIRPFASRKYANDLSVKAILELKNEPFFNELEFLIIGDGVLFDETLEPIKDLSNVKIKRGFLTQDEISKLHKEYGVFLVPTRMDAQGVSRDEAMSSGLIAITNNIAAIPEFVDDDCGFLAPPDDHIKIAEAIVKLYKNKNLFNNLSKKSTSRIDKQSNSKIIIEKELMAIYD